MPYPAVGVVDLGGAFDGLGDAVPDAHRAQPLRHSRPAQIKGSIYDG